MKGGSYLKNKKTGALKRVGQTAPREGVVAAIHGDRPLSARGKEAMAAVADAAVETLSNDEPQAGSKRKRNR